MRLGQRVVQPLAVAERLVQRRVEAVEEAQLELVRALEEVLELGERERDVRELLLGMRLERRRRSSRVAGQEPGLPSAVVEELRPSAVQPVARHRGVRGEQVLLGPGHRDVEQARLVLDGPAVAIGARDRGVRDDVEETEPALPLRGEPVVAEARHEHDRPLHALGLVDRRDDDGVGRGVPDVCISVGVVVGRLVLQPVGERPCTSGPGRC